MVRPVCRPRPSARRPLPAPSASATSSGVKWGSERKSCATSESRRSSSWRRARSLMSGSPDLASRLPKPNRSRAIRAPLMPTRAKLHYGWIIVAVTFTALLGSAGIRAAPGVLIVPFENEFHWSRATISFAVGVNILLTGLVGPFAAAAMDRFGVRRTMALALAVTAAGVALSPLMYNPWQLVLLWGLVVGLSTGFVGAYLAAYIAARWFHARQGMVVGLLTAANAAGQLIFLPTNA